MPVFARKYGIFRRSTTQILPNGSKMGAQISKTRALHRCRARFFVLYSIFAFLMIAASRCFNFLLFCSCRVLLLYKIKYSIEILAKNHLVFNLFMITWFFNNTFNRFLSIPLMSHLTFSFLISSLPSLLLPPNLTQNYHIKSDQHQCLKLISATLNFHLII